MKLNYILGFILLSLTQVLTFNVSVHKHNITIIEGDDPDVDMVDVPRFRIDPDGDKQRKGRKHCFKSPNLYCQNQKRCCTHVSQKKIWCCDRKHQCGKSPKTCVVKSL